MYAIIYNVEIYASVPKINLIVSGHKNSKPHLCHICANVISTIPIVQVVNN